MTWGEAALAALAIATATGVVLVLPFDVQHPETSIARLLLTNPGAAWFRNVHYWSAQAFLVLTGVHVLDWLRRRGERRGGPGAWLRLVLALPATGFLVLSGFLLRGDADARQALCVVVAVLHQIPGVGWLLSSLLAGDGRLQVVYLQHAATLTIFVWLVSVDHGRVRWPPLRSLLLVFAPVAAVSAWLSPPLHDALDRVVKGPWYFLGIQEALHWTTRPLAVAAAGAALLTLLYALRWMRRGAAAWTRGLLGAALLVNAGLTVVGWAGRGEDWAWAPAWRNVTAGLVPGPVWRGLDLPPERLRRAPIPVVLGRPEGCRFCHADVTGLGPAHDPARIGCASCHQGNPFSLDPAVAHRGMERVPGNLAGALRSCGAAGCHAAVIPRVEGSVMNTMSGVVAVDRAVWGEPPSQPPPDVDHLGRSEADSHLRQLCASCHLGAVKAEPGPVAPESRGGGCTACHVRYDAATRQALSRYRRERGRGLLPPPLHPRLTVAVGDDACFGCHSRSGRISLSYAGWHEADPAPHARSRSLQDGRVVYAATPDVHHVKKMQCVDCHDALEVMGDGRLHARKWEQVRIRCPDCHAKGRPHTLPLARADDETQVIRALRPGPAPGRPMLRAARGDALDNTFVGSDGRPRLFRKADGGVLALKPTSPTCRHAAHRRLSCLACHSAWAPRCASCHTRFDPAREGFDLLEGRAVRGDWVETASGIGAAPPTLGVRKTSAGEVVDPFAPGMVGSLDASRGTGPIPIRLYARISPHTVTRAGRSCRSCHADPVALGYGEGTLRYVVSGRRGRWTFTPAHAGDAADGLPADAWIGFLATRTHAVSTRPDARPLSVAEQRRILAVGACLTCHGAGSPVMRAALRDFAAALRRVSAKCALPFTRLPSIARPGPGRSSGSAASPRDAPYRPRGSGDIRLRADCDHRSPL